MMSLGTWIVMQGSPDFELLGSLGPFYGHHHEQVNVTIWSCLTASTRSKEYDRVRVELRCNLADDALDLLFY
jgi:hypothetical protein